jgi:hypothetical protein
MDVILFRESLVEPSELESASKYFDVYFYHSAIPISIII